MVTTRAEVAEFVREYHRGYTKNGFKFTVLCPGRSWVSVLKDEDRTWLKWVEP